MQSRKPGSELINSFVAPETVYGRALLLAQASGELAVNVAVIGDDVQVERNARVEVAQPTVPDLYMAGDFELGHRYASDSFPGLAGMSEYTYVSDRVI